MEDKREPSGARAIKGGEPRKRSSANMAEPSCLPLDALTHQSTQSRPSTLALLATSDSDCSPLSDPSATRLRTDREPSLNPDPYHFGILDQRDPADSDSSTSHQPQHLPSKSFSLWTPNIPTPQSLESDLRCPTSAKPEMRLENNADSTQPNLPTPAPQTPHFSATPSAPPATQTPVTPTPTIRKPKKDPWSRRSYNRRARRALLSTLNPSNPTSPSDNPTIISSFHHPPPQVTASRLASAPRQPPLRPPPEQ